MNIQVMTIWERPGDSGKTLSMRAPLENQKQRKAVTKILRMEHKENVSNRSKPEKV